MKKRTLLVLCICVSTFLFAQDKYAFTADIKNITKDRVRIELTPPAIKESEATFSFPRVIPGSYSEKNFGRYIDEFTAIGKDGKQLKVKKLNKNQFQIKDATKLDKITYFVNDTWDTKDKEFVFQPGGSNIDAGKNIVMNNHAFYGYFEGYTSKPIEIKVIKPASLFGSTHMQVNRKSQEEDIFFAKNYVFLADNPVIYSVPDTTSFTIGSTIINVSCYSANRKVNAKQLAGYLQPMSLALKGFFGKLPVDSYQFLFYFEDPEIALADREDGGGGYGALEHNYSSLYFLPETSNESQLKSMVNDVTSHEFLHILTPLNLHSQHIEKFDFINPTMSKHLWLYEGVTEYFSNLVQWQSGIITEKQFFNNMRDKVNQAEEYGDFAMTTMSERVLEDQYQKKYSTVYNRGALIGLLLDIHIREKTNQNKDLKSVILELAGKYGAGKPFDDNSFIAEFVSVSHPDVQEFMDSYINGEKSLPFNDYLSKLGYEFHPVHRQDIYIIGRMGLKYDEDNKQFLFTEVEKNSLGIKDNDVFVSIDTVQVNDQNVDLVWDNYFMNNTQRTNLSMEVVRDGKKMTLQGPLGRGYREAKNFIQPKVSVSSTEKIFLEKFRKG